MAQKLISYQNGLLVVLAVGEAALLLDRLAVGFLASFLSTDLHFSNLQLGLLSSIFSFCFALSGYVVSRLSDRSGERWPYLILIIVAFSLVSAATGLTTGFTSLMALRALLGLIEGPFLPIALALMAGHSSPGRQSFNLGFVQNFGAFVLAQSLGPIILVALAVHFGWRTAFYFTAVPGVVIAAIMWLRMRHVALPAPVIPSTPGAVTDGKAAAGINIFAYRNIWLAAAMAACLGSWILLQVTFLPKYLIQVVGMSPQRMSLTMSLLGIGGCVASITLPVLSDRVGRKAVLLVGCLVALLTPLGALFAHDSGPVLTLAILVGSCALGCSPLYTSIIPSDTVDKKAAAQAIGVVAACSAIVGGMIMPTIAGRLADSYGLAMPFYMAAGLALMAAFISLWLKPRARRV